MMPDEAHEQRVEQPHQEGAGVRVGRRVRDRALADVEAGAAPEEAEPEAEAARVHRAEQVAHHEADHDRDDRDHDDLRRDAQDALVPPWRDGRGAMRLRGHGRRCISRDGELPPRPVNDGYRYGGA